VLKDWYPLGLGSKITLSDKAALKNNLTDQAGLKKALRILGCIAKLPS
jgi:hypothetical protein